MTNFHNITKEHSDLYISMINRRLKERHSFIDKVSFYNEIRQTIERLRELRNRVLFESMSELLIDLADGKRIYTHNGVSFMLNSQDNKIYTIFDSKTTEFNIKLTELDYRNFYTEKVK